MRKKATATSLELKVSEAQSEYSLHHEFSEAVSERSSGHCNEIVQYIKRFGNPLSRATDGQPIRNIATGEVRALLYKNKGKKCIQNIKN